MVQTEDIDFESHIEKVRDIIKQLNDSNLNLRGGMGIYRKAQAHISVANKMLEEAEFELKNVLEH